MQKISSSVLAFILCSYSFAGFAQTGSPSIPDSIQTCSEQIRDNRSNLFRKAELTAGGGLGLAAVAGVAVSIAAPVIIPIAILGATVVGSTTLLIATAQKSKALKVFDGAASGGNKQTRKLWNRANKKAPEVFGKITYKEFLDSIHKADTSGEACRMKSVPNKDEMLRAVRVDLDDENDVVNMENKAVEQSGRAINQKHDLPSSSPKEEKTSNSSSSKQ